MISCFLRGQEVSTIRKIVSLELDSARYYSKKLSEDENYYNSLIDLWENGGQTPLEVDYLKAVDLNSDDPKDLLLLGVQFLFGGERGEATNYLLKAHTAFKEVDSPLAIVSKWSLLFLNSRIIMSGDGYKNHISDFKTYANYKEAEAWYHIHKLIFVEKLLSPDSIQKLWPEAYTSANNFFEENEINENILAYFLTRKGLYQKYYGNEVLALETLNKSIDYCADKPFLKHLKFLNLLDIAGLYLKKKETDSARIYLNRARNNWDNSDPVLSELNYQIILAGNYYEPAEQWDSAYISLKKILNSSLLRFFESNNIRISELKEEFEAEKRETEIQAQKEKIGVQSGWIIAIGLLLAITLGLSVGLVFSRKKIQSKNQKIETLMRELHHRVKNNLQVVSSLLGLQSMKLKDATARKAVAEGKDRLRAMSLIHQKLYQNEEAISLNIKEYISNLVTELAQSYGYQNKTKFIIDIPSMDMDADNTLPLGLIVNELVSNSFKYAFKEVEEPELEIRLLQENDKEFSFLLRDNGPGFPEGFEIEKASSFGTKLVSILVKQLNGTFRIEQEGGLTYHINFQIK